MHYKECIDKHDDSCPNNMIIYEATITNIDMGDLLFIAPNLFHSKARAWFLVYHEMAPTLFRSSIHRFV